MPMAASAFSNLPRGRFTVQVRSLGYNTVTQTVDTGSGQPLDFKLTPAATEIGQVVVTGVSQATQLRRSPVPTAVVDHTRLNQTSVVQHRGCHCPHAGREPDYDRRGHQQARGARAGLQPRYHPQQRRPAGRPAVGRRARHGD